MQRVAVCTLLLLTTLARADDAGSPEITEFREARRTYETAFADWKADVLEELESAKARARSAGNSSALAALDIEAKNFAEKDLVPTNLPESFRTRLEKIVQPFERTAERSIRQLERQGKDAQATELRTSYASATEAMRTSVVRLQLMGRWEMRNGSLKVVFDFAPDGSVLNENSRERLPYTIDLDRRTVTVQGPGWRDTMYLPLDPRLTKGKNVRGGALEYRKRP